MFSNTSYNLASKQYIFHNTTGIQSPTTTTLVYVKLTVFSFYFVELLVRNTLPIDRLPPVCPLIVVCTTNNSKIYHFNMPLSLALRISGKFLVLLIYFIIWTKLNQSSLSSCLTLLKRNEILIHVFVLDILVAIFFATEF